MAMGEGTDILISLSIATDNTMQTLHMFPGVMFVVVLINTNQETCDLFLVLFVQISHKHLVQVHLHAQTHIVPYTGINTNDN